MKTIRLVLFFLAMFSSALYSGVNLSYGLVAHYEFEGNAKDSSGNVNDGTAKNGVKFSQDGVLGKSALFSDTKEIRIEVPDSNSLDTHDSFSISIWANPSDRRGSVLVQKYYSSEQWAGGEYGLNLLKDGKVRLSIANYDSTRVTDYIEGGLIPLNQWSYITAFFDKGKLKLYLNGNLIAEKTSSIKQITTKEYSYDGIHIGNIVYNTYNDGWFVGKMDDLRIYNRALNEAEIAELYKMKDSTIAQKTIKGTVKENNGKAVSGINVKFEYLVDGKEKSATAVSSSSGAYEIKLDKSAFSDKGVNYLIYAYKKGYHPTTKNIKIGSNDSYSIDFVINKIKANEVVLEIEPKVHHLGNDIYSGSYNSQFQKHTEGLTFSKTFTISGSQYDNYEKATIHFEAKGLEDNYNRLRVNGKVYKLKYAPSDGSYGTFSIDIEKSVYKKGSNSLKISSEDDDDFEFSNIVLEFSGTVEVDKDSDGDGISDKDEIRLGLNPNSKDSDGDGILDGDEIGDINNPKDSDEDGVIDALDSDKDEECTEEEDSDGEIKDCGEEGDTEEEKYVNYDFNGDGVADILWKKGDGFSLWYMSENGKHQYKFIGKKSGYTIAGIADFNGDKIADILWKKGGGNYLWYMKADGKHKYKNIGSKTGYQVSGVADFNGDGLADILWTKNGRNYIWYMDEDGKHSYKSIGKKSGYSVAGVADFNNDGIADILWKKGGGNYLWYMKVDGKHKYKNIGRKTGYTVEGVADFNEDGIADIFWKRGSGNYLWYMKVDGKHKYKNMGRKTGYSVKMVADFDGDGVSDVLWKKGSGNYLWYMETNGKHRYKNIGRKSTSYSIQF